MTIKIEELEAQLKAIQVELEILKSEPQREDAKPVFKRGYAYKNGLGEEYCIVAFDHNNEGNKYPLSAIRINPTNNLLSNIAELYTLDGEVFITVDNTEHNLIHSTERIYDESLIHPAQLSLDQFNVGWMYKCNSENTINNVDDKDRWYRIVFIANRVNILCVYRIGNTTLSTWIFPNELDLSSGIPWEVWEKNNKELIE